jgi:signal transduction histidine kinase
LRSAGEETDRLAQLADDLLFLARADSGQVPLRRSQLDAHELLETIALRFANRIANAGRELKVEAPRDLTLLADRRRLEQALSNLVENALRHGHGSILLQALAGRETLEFRVADEGPGFDPPFLSRAFERFSRAESSHGRPGAGLGLAIVEAVAEGHGGKARASNLVTGGALVTIILPVPVESMAPRSGAPQPLRYGRRARNGRTDRGDEQAG